MANFKDLFGRELDINAAYNGPIPHGDAPDMGETLKDVAGGAEGILADAGIVFIDGADFMAKELTLPRWIVRDFIAVGMKGDLCGKSKTKKTYLGLQLAVSIATGTDFLEYYHIDEPHVVAYINLELFDWNFQERMSAQMSGNGVDEETGKLCGGLGIDQEALRGRLYVCNLRGNAAAIRDKVDALVEYLLRRTALPRRPRAIQKSRDPLPPRRSDTARDRATRPPAMGRRLTRDAGLLDAALQPARRPAHGLLRSMSRDRPMSLRIEGRTDRDDREGVKDVSQGMTHAPRSLVDTRALSRGQGGDGEGPPISGLSEVTGISRVTLGKWMRNACRLYWLTKHISDAELDKPHGRRYYTRDSRFFDKAQRYCERVKAIRAAALSGDLGAQWQRMERERRRNEHKRATA